MLLVVWDYESSLPLYGHILDWISKQKETDSRIEGKFLTQKHFLEVNIFSISNHIFFLEIDSETK